MSRPILITLDRERTLKFGTNNLCAMEEHLGIGLGSLLLSGAVGFRTLRGLLWAALRHEDPKISVQQAGDLIDVYFERGGTLEELVSKLNEALRQAGYYADRRQVEGDNTVPFAASGSGQNEQSRSQSGS